MNSKMFSLEVQDFIKGAVVAVLSAIISTLIQGIQANGFAGIDWMMVLNVASIAFLSYLGKNFASDENGKVGGKL